MVGAGLTGICAGIKLGEAGIDFAMIERADDIGGTWRDCTYPGIAVDVPSAHYSLSFEPNPDWSRTYAPGQELKAYADRLVDKYGLRPRIRLNTNVQRAVWDEEHHVWELHTDRGSHSRALHPQLQRRADRPESAGHRGRRRSSPARSCTPRAGTTTTTSPASGSR